MSITSGQVSRFLRDFADNNILLAEVQFEEEDIADAMMFALAEFNAMTPISSYNADGFPNDWILLLGTAAHLMMSESILQLRNMATYQDGDIQNIGVDDKHAQYSQLGQNLKAEWKATAQKFKQQLNMENGYDSLSSGYRYIYPGARSRR
ncbi:MAG: hypothetical protein COZ56_16015 [Armatimonadetes bacterium CG_4_8_14_3_um_filter_58_9]|nr:MAG: hypothetical protein COZ56_16015 [Armatimonadetes bacterium CG_4_8_14_3_um_filter_58_9]